MAINVDRRRILTAHEQARRFMGSCPTFWTRIERGALVAEGTVRPTSRSAAYKVRVEYRVGNHPEVTVLSPKLVPREEGGYLQHVYTGNHPCLYVPGTREWTPDQSVAETIIPWLAEWLLHYELWHATGEWLGGGQHPPRKEAAP